MATEGGVACETPFVNCDDAECDVEIGGAKVGVGGCVVCGFLWVRGGGGAELRVQGKAGIGVAGCASAVPPVFQGS